MKKLSDPVRKVNTQSVGLDVHKTVTVYCVLDASGNVVREGRLASKRSELEPFVREVLEGGDAHVSFEASRSSLWVYEVVKNLVGKERTHVANAKEIRAIANSKKKNDSNDAWWLAYLTSEGRVPGSYVPEDEVLELRIATRERSSAVQRRTKIINRLKGHLAQIGEVVPSSSVRTKKAQLFLKEIAASTKGSRGRALRRCLDELEYQNEAIEEWDEVIQTIAPELPDIKRIADEIPGLGTVLASTVVAEAGDIRRFHSAKAFGCATGLTPSDRSTSGKTVHGAISREGSPHLRWALTQGAMGCLRSKSGAGLAAGNWIRAKQKRMGIKAKARAAGGRKLAEAIWRLFHYGECFDPARPFGGRSASA
ncbi:MAG: IS110 family transposase [Myxococcota bacterium]